ncbi:MAG TPA: hypothetical protein VM571_12960, partial [Noviherbaspirillum sp.]|nr:hypothetical protein [Noviherbaspirillum sp.]
MKSSSLLLATLALPTSLAFAQTPTAPATTGDQTSYIPLFGSGTGGANGAAGNATWFIDIQRNQVVLCTAQAGGGGDGAQNFTCTSQPVPNTGTPPTT